MRFTVRALGFAAVVAAVLGAPAFAADPTARELLEATDDVTRGLSSVAVIEMHVKTARYERSMVMKAWSEGTENTLIRVLEPAKEAGTSTLKSGDNIWNYLPKVARTMKVPAGMMSGNWMGSHFTNDDLVKESRLADDFTYEIVGRPEDNPERTWVIDAVPKPDAPVVWGKVTARVTVDRLPHDVRYYDEDGALVRTMSFADYRDFDGRRAPAVMTLTPSEPPGEFTRMTYRELDFDVAIPPETFTLQALQP